MELRVLRYLVAVADAGSVTAGAAAVHVSQPSVSRQLRALERELGVTLLNRGDGVSLTAAGAELLPLARDMLEREAFLRRTAVSLAAGRLVSLTWAAPPTTLSDVIAPFLASRHSDATAPSPNVIARAEGVFAALDEGADLVVAPAVPPEGVASMLIAELPVRAYVGSREVLRAGGGHQSAVLPLEAIAQADVLITLPVRYPVRQLLDRAFADAGLAQKRVQEVDSPEAAQAIAASGRGVAVLTNDPRFGLIPRRVVGSDGETLTLSLFAAWRRDHHAASELEATAHELRAFCERLYRDDLA